MHFRQVRYEVGEVINGDGFVAEDFLRFRVKFRIGDGLGGGGETAVAEVFTVHTVYLKLL